MNRSYPLTRLNRRLVSEHISNMVCGPAILAVLAASVLVLHITPEIVSPFRRLFTTRPLHKTYVGPIWISTTVVPLRLTLLDMPK